MATPGARHHRSLRRIAAALGEIDFALPGTLVTRSTACGKPGCRGDPPRLHGPYLSWTRSVGGKTQTRQIGRAHV